MTERERRPFPWVSRGRHLTKLDRLAAYVTIEPMTEEQELRFLLAHPELEPRRRYYG